AEMASSPFQLLDDAARAIHALPVPKTRPRLPPGLRISREEEEQLVSNYIGALLELNLTLPPDPKAKSAPATLEESGKDLALGWDEALLLPGAEPKTSAAAEVSRVLAQSSECQRWNAAYALYLLGVDLGGIFKESFETCVARWRKKKEQGKDFAPPPPAFRAGVRPNMADAALMSAESIMADAKAMFPETPTTSDFLIGYDAPKAQMVSYQQRLLYKSKASEALALAKDALVSFRRAGESAKKVSALKVVVEASMAMERSFDAMMAASDELAMIKRTGNKQAEVDVAEMLSEVQLARGDAGSASQSLNDALALYRELGKKEGEARILRTLAGLKLKTERYKESLSMAQQGLGLFKELGDSKGESDCQKIINRAYAASGEMEKAPNRNDALKALE
ncbi:unnamed protein product, partial [Symbiodinium microadriaticum]